MGNVKSIQNVSFEDIQICIQSPEAYVLINTLSNHQQNCLIMKTISSDTEESLINRLLSNNKAAQIIVYGRNSSDETMYKKYTQLLRLGFPNVYVYPGGLFEWLLLQDIYGNEEFPTTSKQVDILKYKPMKVLRQNLIESVGV